MILDYIYHRGHLAVDRERRRLPYGNQPGPGPLTTEAEALGDKAEALYRSARRGKMILYQQRCPEGFEYHCRAVRGA